LAGKLLIKAGLDKHPEVQERREGKGELPTVDVKEIVRCQELFRGKRSTGYGRETKIITTGGCCTPAGPREVNKKGGGRKRYRSTPVRWGINRGPLEGWNRTESHQVSNKRKGEERGGPWNRIRLTGKKAVVENGEKGGEKGARG